MQENVFKCSKSTNYILSDFWLFIKHDFGLADFSSFRKKSTALSFFFPPILFHNVQMKYFKLKPILFSLGTVYVKCSWWFTVITVKSAKISALLFQNNVVSESQLLTVAWNRMQRERQGSRRASHLGCAAGGMPPPQVQGLASPYMQLHRLPFPHFSCQDAPMGLSTNASFVSAPLSRSPRQIGNEIYLNTNWWCSGSDRLTASHRASGHSPLSPRVQPDFNPPHWLLI